MIRLKNHVEKRETENDYNKFRVLDKHKYSYFYKL